MSTSKPARNPLMTNIVGKWFYEPDVGVAKVIEVTDEKIRIGKSWINIFDITECEPKSLIDNDDTIFEYNEYKIIIEKWGRRIKTESLCFLVPQPPKTMMINDELVEDAVLSSVIDFKNMMIFSSLWELISVLRRCQAYNKKTDKYMDEFDVYDKYIKTKKEAKAETVRCLVKKSPLPVELKKMITDWL
jgi:hypothetical protein